METEALAAALANPLTGDYYDRYRRQFRCFLATHGNKGVEVGCYSARLSKEERSEASRIIWEAVLGEQ